MPRNLNLFVIISSVLLSSSVFSEPDGSHSHVPAGGYDYPPPPSPVPDPGPVAPGGDPETDPGPVPPLKPVPGPGAGPIPPVQPAPGPGAGPFRPPGPGIPGGLFGFPGFGLSKNININALAGYLPFLGGLGGGFGGPGPLPPPAGGVGPVPGGPGFGIPGFGSFLGPSYMPATWIGSALGAKGDILYPCVIFAFFIVGIWTVVKFLIALVVPLIAKKIGVVKGAMTMKKLRSVEEDISCEQDNIELAHNVTEAIDKKY